MLRGFIVPHSHDDVGWLFTIDDYYEVMVQHIYNTVVEALYENPARKFISVEMAYLYKWWTETATPQQKANIRTIVERGQLEFIVGGWTMEDEACTTYSANIDQMTQGHVFINNTFGVRPRLGWQIDPFGHSSVVHGQFAQMGFDGTVLDRIDYNLKGNLTDAHGLEFTWHTSRDPNNSPQIFTHIMDYYMYSTAVWGLTWDIGDPLVTEANIKPLSDSIVANIKTRASWYATNNILFPWGTDFEHHGATLDFMNMDLLVNYINANSQTYGVTVQYATLSDFFNAVESSNYAFPSRNYTDFFPYASAEFQYWTGYYTSRPALKGYVRSRENVLRAAELLHASVRLRSPSANYTEDIAALEQLRMASGEATHHDAVAGTSTPWVVQMYADHLRNGTDAVTPVMTEAIGTLAADAKGNAPTVSYDPATMQKLAGGNVVALVVYNALGWNVTQTVRVPCFCSNAAVANSNNAVVPFEVRQPLPTYPLSCLAEDTCGYPDVEAPFELLFEAQLPPVGFSTYFVSLKGSQCSSTLETESPQKETEKELAPSVFYIQNSVLQLGFSQSTGALVSITNLISNVSTSVQQNFFGYTGNNTKKDSEGTYVFFPVGPAEALTPAPLSFEVLRGEYVQEVRQVFTGNCDDRFTPINCGVSQAFRLYTGSASLEAQGFVEVIQSVGPLNIMADVVTRYSTGLNTAGTVYTDNNCFAMQKRTYDPTKSSIYAGNFYPVACTALLRDDAAGLQFSVLTDRSQAGASLQNGQVEIMLHRRSLEDDSAGPNDDDFDRLENVRYLLSFDTINNAVPLRTRLQYLQQFPPSTFFGVTPTTSDWTFKPAYSTLLKPLPDNVHLLTTKFQSAVDGRMMLRLAHLFEFDDPTPLAKPITVTLSDYLPLPLTAQLTETLLNTMSAGERPTFSPSNPITLNPLDVRTFLVQL